MSTQAAEQHKQAAAQYGHAARHYQEAAAHHHVGHYEQAAHHTQIAQGHHVQATAHASAAAKSHAEYYGRPENVWAEAQVYVSLPPKDANVSREETCENISQKIVPCHR